MSSIDKTPIADKILLMMKSNLISNSMNTGRIDNHMFRTNTLSGDAVIATNVTYVPSQYQSKNTIRLPKVFIFERLDRKCCIVGFLPANQMEEFMRKVDQERQVPIGDLTSHEYTLLTAAVAAQRITEFFSSGTLPDDEPLKRKDFFN